MAIRVRQIVVITTIPIIVIKKGDFVVKSMRIATASQKLTSMTNKQRGQDYQQEAEGQQQHQCGFKSIMLHDCA